MSYRIITYRDPYHLDNTSFWDEIKDLPHFCASEVMAMSLWDLYKDRPADKRFSSFFFPLDDLVKVTYDDWENNIERQILQYSALSRQLRKWETMDGGKRPALFSALQQNKSSLLDALRMFCELNIDPESLNKKLANTEQQVFIILYHYITRYEGKEDKNQDLIQAFQLSDCRIYQKQAFPALIQKAIDREKDEKQKTQSNSKIEEDDRVQASRKNRDRRIERLEELEKKIQNQTPTKIVIHGIHQFKPLQIRLISALSDSGCEIIFLYNNLEEYPHIYETWNRLYSLFDVPIERSEIIRPYKEMETDPTSKELSVIMAGLLNARGPVRNEARKKWIQQTRNVPYTVFENTAEMANYVSELIHKHIKPGTSKRSYAEQLPEKFYSASKDADDLLKVFFPELLGDRHFLQYPVGQFFANLYRMWDEDKRQLVLDPASMKACAVSGILNQKSGEKLSGLLDLISPLIEDVSLYEDVAKRLNDYRSAFQNVKRSMLFNHLKHMALYNPEQISEADIQEVIDFLGELKNAAETIFSDDKEIIFQKHFANLEEYIRGRADQLAREEEKALVENLLERFNRVPMNTRVKGTMDDLRHGLYYYLAQDKDENPAWIIRNFEQIEGDILRSREQVEAWKNVTYHFAALSDGTICKKTDDLLPWPLTDYFTHVVYSPVAMVFQVYYCALTDRTAYMQYALFYGLRFNRAHVKLSYIHHISNDKEEQFYYPLQILNLKKQNYTSGGSQAEKWKEAQTEPEKLPLYEPNRFEKMDFFLCPYRYYLDYICSSEIVHTNPFLIRRFYQAMLSNLVRENYQGKKLNRTQIQMAVEAYQAQLDQYFPFLKNINDKPDIKENAVNYILNNMIDKKTEKIESDTNHHGQIREIFIKALFREPEDTAQEHPIKELREYIPKQLVKDPARKGNEEIKYDYSLAKVEARIRKEPLFARNLIKDYLMNSREHLEHTGEWCSYCRYRGLCKKPFMKSIDE